MAEPAAIAPFRVEVVGGSLAVFRLGAAEAPPVLAVHGITASSRAWLAVARALGDTAQLIALDLRGRGASNRLPPPYGTAVHVRDIVATLDHLGLERAVLLGHSLGGYVVARTAVEYPDRVAAAVMVDGGLTIPGSEGIDPQAFADAFLGPALARLRMTFASREAYFDWWRRHPALSTGAVSDADLHAYADHDLVGEEPDLHPAPNEDAVRADAGELAELGGWALQLSGPATLLSAPRGLQDDPQPMQPIELVRAWAQADPEFRQARLVPDVNHYTITLAEPGARAIADALAEHVKSLAAAGGS